MIFKTHEANIAQIKGALKAFDAIYFHGDGNIYPALKQLDGEYFSKASNDRQTFANPNQEEATYRTLFKKGEEVPKSVDELNKVLMDSKNQDILTKRTIKEAAGITTFSADSDDEETAADDTSIVPDDNAAADDTKVKKAAKQ